MNPTSEELLRSAWAARLGARPTIDKVEEGFLTQHQAAKLLNVSDSYAYKLLRSAVEQGKCEKKIFRVRLEDSQCLRPVAHYRLTE